MSTCCQPLLTRDLIIADSLRNVVNPSNKLHKVKQLVVNSVTLSLNSVRQSPYEASRSHDEVREAQGRNDLVNPSAPTK